MKLRMLVCGGALFTLSILANADPTHSPASRSELLIAAATAQTLERITYNGSYFRIGYPMGDVPSQYGVCTDVIIRAYRKLGIDLQQRVHEDIRKNFSVYPARKIWGQTRPDTNIDHRRVPNLQTFFVRHGKQLKSSLNPGDYQPGDLVTWMLARNLPHIGLVSQRRSTDGLRPLIIHNIGAGPQEEDVLFAYQITGHYRYDID